VASRFNHLLVDRLVEGAVDCIIRHGGSEDNIEVARVPGSWEIPVAVKKFLEREDIDAVILTVGRKPNTYSLGLERIGISLTQRGHIEVNEKYQTSVENIYAVGDVIETPALAHVASHEAKLAVRNIFENSSKRLDYTSVPSVVYSVYEIGSFGFGEKQLKTQGVEYKTSTVTFRAVAKAISEGEEGLIKVFHTPEGQILGANILSKKHTDSILHLLLLAKKGGLSVNELREIVWAHPTIEEVLELL